MNEANVSPEAPKNVIVVLLDSLNRHMLGAYGGREFATPNLSGAAIASDLADRLRTALIEIEAPDDQLERLGMK